MSVDPIQTPEDLLDNAIGAMRDGAVPSGPSPLLIERTRQAIHRQPVAMSIGRTRLVRWAAVIALGASAVTVAAIGGRSLLQVARKDPAPASPAVVQPVAVTGLVKLDGPAPLPRFLPSPGGPHCGHNHAPPVDESIVVGNGGGLANVVVAVSAGLPSDMRYELPRTPAVLDQKDCKYLPRMVAMQVGQELVARNSDPFFHNVHTNSMVNRPVNIAQPQPDLVGKKLKSVATAETFKVTCDVHPWMVAWVAAFDHPYYAVTKPDGSFSMPPLAAGTYTIKAWHERLGAVEQKVVIGADGKLPPVQFTFGAERLAAALGDREMTAHAGEAVKPDCCKN